MQLPYALNKCISEPSVWENWTDEEFDQGFMYSVQLGSSWTVSSARINEITAYRALSTLYYIAKYYTMKDSRKRLFASIFVGAVCSCYFKQSLVIGNILEYEGILFAGYCEEIREIRNVPLVIDKLNHVPAFQAKRLYYKALLGSCGKALYQSRSAFLQYTGENDLIEELAS